MLCGNYILSNRSEWTFYFLSSVQFNFTIGEKILDILKETIVVENNDNSQEIMNQISAFEQIKNLISVDTLKTMQLLGFNFKIAIGEPLTNMLKNFINSKSPASTQYEVFEKFITPEMVEILKSETAYNNLKNMMAGNDTIEN